MFSLFLRASRSLTTKMPLNNRIDTSMDNRNLLNIYNENKLTKDQKVMVLKRLVSNLKVMDQILVIFKTALGQRYFKETLSEINSYNPEHKIYLLSILASTSGKYRKNVITINQERDLIDNISNTIDPTMFPEECLKAYKFSAILERMNITLETKVIFAIESNPNLPLSVLKEAIKGSVLTYRDNSYKICSKALEKIEKQDCSIASINELVELWQMINDTILIYNLGEKAQENITEKILLKIDEMDIKCINDIVKGYTINENLSEKILLPALKVIFNNVNNTSFFWGDNLEEIILNLGVLKINRYPLDIKDEYFALLTDLVIKLKMIGKIKSSEAYSLFNILFTYTQSITEFASNYLRITYNEPGQHLYGKICISSLFCQLNNEKMKRELIDMLKNTEISQFSLASVLQLYIILTSINLQFEYPEIKNILQMIENRFSSVIVDIDSYMSYTSILLKSQAFLRHTRIWDHVGKVSVEVFSDIYRKKLRQPRFILTQLINFHKNSSNYHSEWVSLVKTISEEIDGNEIYCIFYNKFEKGQISGLVECLTFYPKLNNFAFIHLLTMQIYQPSNFMLEKITSLFSRYDIEIYKEKNLRLAKYCLFVQIFRKGYSKKIHSFLENQSYLKCIDRNNMKTLIDIMNLSAQYGHLSSNQATILDKMKLNEIIDNPMNVVALATVKPSILKESNETFEKFFNIEGNDLFEVVGKFNLYIKFNSSFKGQDKFIEDIEAFVSSIGDESPLVLIEFVQSISEVYSKKKKNDFKQILYFCVETLMNNEFHKFSIDDLANLLIALLEKNYDNEEYIKILENLIGNKLMNEDIIEHLIRTYLKNKRFNTFLDLNYSVAINYLKDSTFSELVELKNI